MSGFLIILIIALVFIVIYQIAKASEYSTILRGEEVVNKQVNNLMVWLMVAFFFLGLWGIWECHQALIDKMLPTPASEHGVDYKWQFDITLYITGAVFFMTHILLFWFIYRYQYKKERSSYFYPHNNKLEIIWTTVPAITLAVLIAIGLRSWSHITSEAPKDAQVVEIVGKQFNWLVRYPGYDKNLGKRDFRMINDADNILGLDWKDKANMDDVISESGEMHLIVNKPVKLIINSRDVIHDVGLPHFRLKMDAVPGVVTTLWFTPLYTTEQMKKMTGKEDFVYEIACDQMCGKGHYSMRGTVIVETEAEYKAWLAKQKSYYSLHKPTTTTTPVATTSESDDKAAISMNTTASK